MQTIDIGAVLNTHLGCTCCRASGSWDRVAVPMTRQNSVIHQLRCSQCGERVFAKVSGGKHWSDNDRVQLQHEYTTLCALQSAFPMADGLGTLEPLGYMEASGRGILVTRRFNGTDLIPYARGSSVPALERAFRQAGEWLLELHGADHEDRPLRSLGVAEKIEDLLLTYGDVLRKQSRMWNTCELLISVGHSIETLSARMVRIHGDFKPQNMMYADTRCVGLDIHWGIIAAAVYDLAPFLNHLWLAGVGSRALSANARCILAERAFLAGYGYASPMRALRWTQLYFALCYLGRYRRRGGVAAVYSTWRVWSLIRRLERQLREIG